MFIAYSPDVRTCHLPEISNQDYVVRHSAARESKQLAIM